MCYLLKTVERYPLSSILAVLFFIGWIISTCSPAKAADWQSFAMTHRHYHRSFVVPFYYDGPTNFYNQYDSGPRVLQVTPRADADPEADARWLAFCKPTKTVDDYGVTRLNYAERNCDLGRDH